MNFFIFSLAVYHKSHLPYLSKHRYEEGTTSRTNRTSRKYDVFYLNTGQIGDVIATVSCDRGYPCKMKMTNRLFEDSVVRIS